VHHNERLRSTEASKSGAFAQICAWTLWKDHGSRPVTGNHGLVEAGGQLIRGFRSGPDYAFIRACADAERVMPQTSPAAS
jgi:hypothetical protein